MRIFVCAVALCAATPALADSCGGLAEQVSSATGIAPAEREPDFVSFTVDPETTVTLACGSRSYASLGAHHRGEDPPDSYFELFGKAGAVVTGIAAERISTAARRARADAPRLRHSNVPVDGLLVTCTFSRPKTGDALTMCAVIAQSDQT